VTTVRCQHLLLFGKESQVIVVEAAAAVSIQFLECWSENCSEEGMQISVVLI
jgi:hypothetical protein